MNSTPALAATNSDKTGASRIPAALSWNGKVLRLLDQTKLPAEEVYIDVASVALLEDCIFRLVVRGAPAIGCAAAFGTVLIAREISKSISGGAWLGEFDRRCEHLIGVRPTAVNLKWAVERCRRVVHEMKPLPLVTEISAALDREAQAILSDDKAMCNQIGRHGAEWLCTLLGKRKEVTLMTHCNAGALATGGTGTALAVMYAAQNMGLNVNVFADETRPLLQGARLTSWELSRAGIDVTVICDNMAASVLRDRKPDAVIVGADRIAANGDTANKIGTYGLAILAKHHGVPFLVAAPSSTFDLTLENGSEIPIEERARKEIAESNGRQTVPDEADVFNPAFDVTPAALIAGWVTEKGVLKPPFSNL